MPAARYRKPTTFVRDITISLIHLHNGDEIGLNLRQQTIARALKQQASPRQIELLYLYYVEQMSMQRIGDILHLHQSSVCRTLHRGEEYAHAALELIEK